MAEVRVGKNESLDTALKRFKRSCAKDGVIAEVRKRERDVQDLLSQWQRILR